MATAVQVESIWNGLTDNSGQPLAAGKVYTYSAGTTTPVSLYTSSDKSTSATNPLILDGNGKAQVWADGRYKFVVKSAADVTLYTLDNLLYGFDDTTVLLGGISTGSANAQVVSVPATVESYANGQRITFIAGYTNSGAVTLQFNSLAPISIVKGPTSSSLQAGDLIAGQLYSCTYYGGSFRLENVPTPADVQRSRAQVIASVAGINTITGTLTPALTGYETGEVFRFKAANASTSAVTINIDGLGPKAIQYNNAALVAGEIAANVWHEIVYDGTQFQLLNPVNVSAPLWGGTTAGTSTAYTITPAPAITAYAAGQRFTFKAHAANGAAPTLAVSGLAAKTMQRQGTALVGNELIANDLIEVEYDGTNFQILNLPTAPLFVNRTNNRVGIGTTSPASAIHVSSAGDAQITLEGTGGAANDQSIYFKDTTSNWYVGNRYDGGAPNNESFGIGRTASKNDFTIDKNGGATLTSALTINNGIVSGIGVLNVQFDGSVDDFSAGRSITGANYIVSKSIYDKTTVAGANVAVELTSGSYPLRRSTSSIKYKKDVVDLDPTFADKLHRFRPVFFKSKCFGDHPEWTHYGFIAEELAEIEPRFVSFGYQPDDYEDYEFVDADGKTQTAQRLKADAQPEPEGVYYDRIVTFLTSVVQRQQEKLDALEARIAVLEA